MAAEPGYVGAIINVNRLSNIYDISLIGNGSSAHYSFISNNYIKVTNNVYIANTCYAYSSSIKSVNLHNIPWVNNSIMNAFSGCTYLTNVTGISNTVTNAYCTFSSCSYLTNAPTLPDSIVSMDNTYSCCYNLINVPSLPNNLTSMKSTFSSCNRLKNIPVIPESVTNMRYTFNNCSNLVNAPVIPNNVTYMGDTFNNCVNLTGKIYIQSSNITYANDCFNKTSLSKYVYIPFTYENGVNTKTYNAFISAGYKTDGSVNGVYLKDINVMPTYTITYEESEYTASPEEGYGLIISSTTKENVDLSTDFIISEG